MNAIIDGKNEIPLNAPIELAAGFDTSPGLCLNLEGNRRQDDDFLHEVRLP